MQISLSLDTLAARIRYQSVLCATHNTTHNRVGEFSRAAEQNTKRVVWTK